ncbi:FxDxF family PEP-CTERM protein [Rugamonas sp.]|uniref:FxDxF family PEP-CTERM protein n=1 Tax=Rugamonas sp. TaxID=1926287 RepID=UPI0025EE1CC7|nr:FxDxF family PEP-CTERM protein [Rugamonas sp.]
MKNINKLLITAVLALCGATEAYAVAPTSGTQYVPMDAGSPGVYTTSWSFSDQSTGAIDDPFAAAHRVGGEFEDYFVFNVPDTETVSFHVKAVKNGSTWGVDFIDGGNGGFALFTANDETLIDYGNATKTQSIKGGSWTLTSGTYVLEVVGDYAVKNGLYTGEINGIPVAAVPEPSSALMLLAGLAGLAGVIRMRKRQA